MCLSPELRDARVAGRLVLLSPFSGTVRRTSSQAAMRRDAYLARVSSRLLAWHATPGGRLEALCAQARAEGKPVYAPASERNRHLLALGARPLSRAETVTLV